MKVWTMWHNSKFKSHCFARQAPSIALLVYIIDPSLVPRPCLDNRLGWKCTLWNVTQKKDLLSTYLAQNHQLEQEDHLRGKKA